MATGSMAIQRSLVSKPYCKVLAMLLSLLPLTGVTQEVGLAGILGSKALLMINGGEPQSVPVGQTLEGVKVVSIQGDQAVIEIGGKKRPLKVGQHAVGLGNPDGSGKVILTADGQGHFYTTGNVNGASVRFVVDTGATSIALGPTDARRIGLDLSRGQKGMVSTANGQAVVTRVTLDTVRIGDITLHQVEAVVLQNEMPSALLGMTFLNRVEMLRDGATMTLKKRF